jgi:hypothetical protein
VSQVYLAGKNAVATFKEALAVMDGSYDAESEFDEMTNTKSGGFYSSVPTIKKWTGSLDCAYEGDSPPDFDEGELIEGASITIPGGPSISGDVYIDKVTFKSVTAKGGVKYSFTFHSEGPYTRSN